MLKEIKIKDPMYQSSISYLVGGSEADLYKFLRRRHGKGVKLCNKEASEVEAMREPDSASTDGMQFHVNEEEEYFYVWVQRKDIGLVFHETMHLAFDVLSCRGIEYADECEDAFCYWGAAVYAEAHRKIFNSR